MSKMNSEKPFSGRVRSNLLQQDCYVRDCSLAKDVDCPLFSSEYVTLHESVTQTGLKQEFVNVPYPITPESVNSYVESCDYRRDPFGAVSSAPKRVNLGDVSQLQDVSGMDSEQARALYAQLSERFGSAQAQAQAQAQTEDSIDSEVNCNG